MIGTKQGLSSELICSGLHRTNLFLESRAGGFQLHSARSDPEKAGAGKWGRPPQFWGEEAYLPGLGFQSLNSKL